MADVLATPMPKPWIGYPEYTHEPGDLISDYSSDFLGSSDRFVKQSPSHHTDWYSVFCPSTSNSPLEFHLLSSPSLQTQQRPRKPSKAMLNQQHRLPGHPAPLMENRRYTPLRAEGPRTSVYSQSVSPFGTQLDLNSALSSTGSTYYESDLDSLDHCNKPFTTRNVETHAGLVHPAPRSNMFTVASSPFRLGTEEVPSLSPFAVSDTPRDENVFSNSQFNVPNPNIANYPMTSPLNHYPDNNAHLVPSSIQRPDSRLGNWNGYLTWCDGASFDDDDIWYPTSAPGCSSEDSGWGTRNGYSTPWPLSTAYTGPNEYSQLAPHDYGPSRGLPMPPFEPMAVARSVPTVPTVPMSHISQFPVCEPYVPSIEVRQYQPEPHSMYQARPPTASPDQKSPKSLSSSFSASTNEEEQSPQQSGEDQASIETGLHYTDERNTFLIDCKRRGLSYKDIKRVGGFKEAESTLRGRYRTLTKSKDQRVRKPRWQEKDIRLLCLAVTIHTEEHDAYSSLADHGINMNQPPKVSWKKVAEHIWANGGSYHFGNATCKKKWCEIHHIML
ncbi:hypothetical protein N7516_010558 [Penicillium verrucosum]|uniref:uncharacterized protein n=1 Tax=Penicillium verrucosum TaxID=60171 RepID=UPI002545AD1B|nr:uncharacterized protein N7516_010558 [Penicillium verrucosum]KAJ5922855.1 hypothetical protein N7516_010558 [Penicillium verrucosum]